MIIIEIPHFLPPPHARPLHVSDLPDERSHVHLLSWRPLEDVAAPGPDVPHVAAPGPDVPHVAEVVSAPGPDVLHVAEVVYVACLTL